MNSSHEQARTDPALGSGSGAMTSAGTASSAGATAAGLTATLGLAAACWVIAVRQMSGMDMGVATRLGSFAFFIALWVAMMAAKMLPGFPEVYVDDLVEAQIRNGRNFPASPFRSATRICGR